MKTAQDDDLDPRQLILREYSMLEGAVEPLAQLLKVNPQLAGEIIRLAMVLGIRAEEHHEADVRRQEVAARIATKMGATPRW